MQFAHLKKHIEESDSSNALNWNLNKDDWGKTKSSTFAKMQRKDVYSDWRGNILTRDTAFGDAHKKHNVKWLQGHTDENLELKLIVRDPLKKISKSGKPKFHVNNN